MKTNLDDCGAGFRLQTEREEKRQEREQRAKSISERGGGESVSGRGNLRKVAWAWVVAVVGEERILAGHDVSWSAASEVGIIVWSWSILKIMVRYRQYRTANNS